MSDNLIIREDGVGRLIRGVDALEIKLQNGGTSRWVRFNPKDQKSVNANGEYHAKDDNVDGYRTITVNVPTRTKSQEPGRDQEIFNPDTGTVYYTDDNGLLHEEFVPDEIRIMHVPDKTTYQDGEPIDLEGIVVQAYRDGEVWTSAKYPDGYIPVHELTITPSVAEIEAARKTIGEFDGQQLFYESTIILNNAFDHYRSDFIFSPEEISMLGEISGNRLQKGKFFIQGSPDYYRFGWGRNSALADHGRGTDGIDIFLSTVRNPEKSWDEISGVEAIYLVAHGQILNRIMDLPQSAFQLLPKISEGTTIVWHRPKDGKILSAKLNISVEAAS